MAWPSTSFTGLGTVSVKTYVQMMHVLETHPNVHRLWSASSSQGAVVWRGRQCSPDCRDHTHIARELDRLGGVLRDPEAVAAVRRLLLAKRKRPFTHIEYGRSRDGLRICRHATELITTVPPLVA